MKNIFEIASRGGFRFNYKGSLHVSDLWDLSVEELDSIFKTLNAKFNQTKEESLLAIRTKKDSDLEVQIEIVRHIVKVKTNEANIILQAKDRKDKQQQIMQLIVEKENEVVKDKSIEELKAMLTEI